MRWLTLTILTLGACTSVEPPTGTGAARTVPAVEVVAARSGALPLVERVTGTVSAAGQVTIFPNASGPVTQVLVRDGQTVRRGDVLVRIQVAGAQAQLQQARSNLAVAEAEVREIEAGLANARTQYERASELGARGLMSRQDVDTLRAEAAAQQASLARARAQVAAASAAVSEQSDLRRQSDVRSPINGRIGQRNVEVGMRVDPQTPLFIVGQLDLMRVEAPVTQELLARLRQGHPAEIHISGAAAPIAAQISRISPFLEPGSFTAEVEIDVPSTSALLPGMFVTVDLFYGESRQATLIPVSAAFEDPRTGERGVYLVEDLALVDDDGGSLGADPIGLQFRPLTVVADGRHTLAVEGLAPGEWVVVLGQHLLAEHASEAGRVEARVRATDWDEILSLQRLQREDLLLEFMERQRRLSQPGGSAGGR
jgi:HlyD family secretion protein